MADEIWLVGSGNMAREYARVLTALGTRFLVVGRGDENAGRLEREFGCEVLRGGLAAFLSRRQSAPGATAIVAVNTEECFEVVSGLIAHGVERLLIEKPGAVSKRQLADLEAARAERGVQAFVGYNRRFYGSVGRAIEIIAEDQGATSAHFEFTEWVDEIAPLTIPDLVKRFWVIANSSHVIDLAFFLAGAPVEMATYRAGRVSWHPDAAVFAGAGVTEAGALFSYDANWGAPGRWSVEVLTRSHRLLFRPLETLQVQRKGTLAWESVDIARTRDDQFKPGLYLQTEAFLQGDLRRLKTLARQLQDFEWWYRIAGYDPSV